MLETAIDLAAQGYKMTDVLRAFAEVKEFRALMIGKTLEPNTMSFEELLEYYGKTG
jgi:hypothetical protein